MNFVVETGTGSSTSTSYASVADFLSYWVDRGVSYADPTETIQAWLNLATEYIDMTYRFEGTRVFNEQALEWPRLDATNSLEFNVLSNEIPVDLIRATCYLAAEAKKGLLVIDQGIKSQSFGPVRTEYSKSATYKNYTAVNKYLRYFLVGSGAMMRVYA